MSAYPSGLSPQEKAAYVSACNRRARVEEAKARGERRAALPAEHERGEHDGIILIGCALCEAALRSLSMPRDAGGRYDTATRTIADLRSVRVGAQAARMMFVRDACMIVNIRGE